MPTPADLVPLLYAETGLPVDRNTIRRAVKELAGAGIVQPRSGAGTFVISVPGPSIPEAPSVSPLERRLAALVAEAERRLGARIDELQRQLDLERRRPPTG